MATDVLMPVLTEPGEDGVVTAWMVDEGQRCEAGQLIAEIQVEKVAEQVYASEAGAVVGLVPINVPVPQGEPICRIVAAEEAPEPVAPAKDIAGSGPARVSTPASPAARRLAREKGVDLAKVSGTGTGGRITESDVRAAAERQTEETGMVGLRAVIARNMRRGHLETAPVTLTSGVDLESGPPEHMTASVIKAVALALSEHPSLNGTRDGDRFIPAVVANVAVAVQTDQGLVSPVVRSPADNTVTEIHEEIRGLAERARNRELAMADYEGGTFTVTNLGSHGVDGFTPIINLPQVAVLGIGAVRRVPVFAAGGLVTEGSRVVLSLTFDHAFVDGAPAADFLRRVGELLGSVS
ncbi:MAG TPA: dihydrolipoamide acetyltransferase family protein [Acidimicrobiia bacterium]|nr:dihydrolipoamide acetyltransferase family protein [Acidimicrobiia bacterium]